MKEAFSLRNRIIIGANEILPMKLFNYSITYLALLFLLIGIDPLIS
jgi:heme O synthase-like polyprenyltransferase